MTESPNRAPTHRGLKVFCPKEGAARNRRQALVDVRAFCLSGCPFYKGRDKDGIFCSFDPATQSSAPKESSSVSRPL